MDREIWRGKDVGYIVKKKMNRSCRKNGMVSVNRWGFRSVNRAVKKGEGKEMDQEIKQRIETLKKETGFGTDDLNHRVMDFGLEEAFLSHHPYIVPEPLTLEPCESCSRDDIDEYVGVYTEMCREAYEEPELLRNAPHNCAIHRMKVENTEKWEELGTTLMQYEKRRKE